MSTRHMEVTGTPGGAVKTFRYSYDDMPDFPEKTYSIDDELIDIVSTPEHLGGAPRLDGHRIAVYHILSFYRAGHSIAEIAGEEIYPALSEACVRAALHYAVDYPEAVEQSSKPPETPLFLVVSYDSKEGGPALTVYDTSEDGPRGRVADAKISIDDLPTEYDERDLWAAWHWMHEGGE